MNENKIFLIIDDDAEDCDFFCEAVAEVDASSKCYKSHNAEEALSQLRSDFSHLPDYIFLDLNMPRMNGKECLQELKNDQVLKTIPVVIYSTSSSRKDIDETLQLGAEYFLTKPSEFKIICNEISNIIKHVRR